MARRDSTDRLAGEKRPEHRPKLSLGLNEFGPRIALRDDPNTGGNRCLVSIDLSGTNRHRELAVARRVNPAGGPAITMPIETLELIDQGNCVGLGCAPERWRWMDSIDQIENRGRRLGEHSLNVDGSGSAST